MITVLDDDADDQRDRRRLRRPGPVRGPRADRRRPRGARRPRRAQARTRCSSGAASARTTSSSRGSRPSGSSGRSRSPSAALAATRSGRTRIVPARFEKVWEHWLTNIRDWNVSRQLWWGHRIPAWYCPDGHVTVSPPRPGPTACDVCGRPAAELTQDPDIFDTWFSSGLWPFSTLGWPDDTPDLRRYYPASVMETGYDIIFFWVARMMMLGLHLTDARAVPHGLPVRPDPGPVRPADVEDEGQRRRPARGHRRDRRRRAAVRAHPRRDAGQRPEVRAAEARERPQLRQQALERDALRPRRAAGHRSPAGAARLAPDAAAPRPGRALDPVARGRDDRARSTGRSPTTPSPR